MLVLARKEGEQIVMTIPPSDKPTEVRLEVARIRRISKRRKASDVQLAFTAPDDVIIDRLEVHEDKCAGAST